jgi:hypothetical protein
MKRSVILSFVFALIVLSSINFVSAYSCSNSCAEITSCFGGECSYADMASCSGSSGNCFLRTYSGCNVNPPTAISNSYSECGDCSGGVCSPVPPPSPPFCYDSDGGLNYNIKGNLSSTVSPGTNFEDYCLSSTQLIERYCTNDPNNFTVLYNCSNGCINGTCSDSSQEQVCQSLIDKIKNPQDIEVYGNIWQVNTNSGMWDDRIYINDKFEHFNEYSSSWYTYSNWEDGEDYKYENLYIFSNVMVFDNKNVDLNSWFNEQMRGSICTISKINEQIAYICGWDDVVSGGNIGDFSDSYNSPSKQILWFKDNVMVRLYSYSSESLTESEFLKISQERMSDFINKLQNNEKQWISYDNLGIKGWETDFIVKFLDDCSSDVKSPLNKQGDECWPSWSCKIEPVICPEYGYQTISCQDYSCDQEYSSKKYCNPGICSGCLSPRWFEGKDNICIPYGTRFEQVIGVNPELVSGTDSERLDERAVGSGDYSLEIISDTQATFILGDKTYDFTEGNTVLIEDDGPQDIVNVFIDDVVYNPNGGSYVMVTVTWTGYYNVETKVNSYCDFDGEIKRQKQSSELKCQNNYECESNICSSGECVDLKGELDKQSGFRTTVIKLFCKVLNPISTDQYNQCLAEYLDI